MRVGSKTDKGRVREQNEDSYGYKDNLFVVADGMGGHQAGEIASAIAVETLLATDFDTQIQVQLEQAILKANEAILNEVAQHPELSGMGTTIAVLIIEDQTVYLAHVGDSRIYHYNNDQLKQLTKDHSLVAELVKNGVISENEAKYHPQRNILTQALGSPDEVKIEFQSCSCKPGDKFLLCSDGLSNLVDADTLREILQQDVDPQVIADKMVDLANENGGSDNITVIVVEV
ncbi:MAG TPA: Stp1/IreP family PP2C-type Ser/Thr phosphatase [Bacillota bacterium]